MTATASPGAPWRELDERGFPAIIAHAAGNGPETVQLALEGKADFVEVDIWFRAMDFELRHERRVGRLPLLYEKWYLSRPAASPFSLLALFELLDGKAGVFLDIKNGRRSAAEAIASVIERAPAGAKVAASSQWWPVLRHLHDIIPSVPLFYSVDSVPKLDLFRSVIRRDDRPAGVSCRASLLTEPVVRELKDRGMRVAAWTVDDLSRAAVLESWGVDAVITHLPGEVHTLFTAAP